MMKHNETARQRARTQQLLKELRAISDDPIPCFLLGITLAHDSPDDPVEALLPSASLEELRQHSLATFKDQESDWVMIKVLTTSFMSRDRAGAAIFFGNPLTEKVCRILRREGLSVFDIFDPRQTDEHLIPTVRYSYRYQPRPTPRGDLQPPLGLDEETLLSYWEQPSSMNRYDPLTKLMLNTYIECELQPVPTPFVIEREFSLGSMKRTKTAQIKRFKQPAILGEQAVDFIHWEFEAETHDLVESISEALQQAHIPDDALTSLHPGDWATRKLTDSMPPTDHEVPPNETELITHEVGRWAYWWLRRRNLQKAHPEISRTGVLTKDELETAAATVFGEDTPTSYRTLVRRAMEYAESTGEPSLHFTAPSK